MGAQGRQVPPKTPRDGQPQFNLARLEKVCVGKVGRVAEAQPLNQQPQELVAAARGECFPAGQHVSGADGFAVAAAAALRYRVVYRPLSKIGQQVFQVKRFLRVIVKLVDVVLAHRNK